MTSQNIEVADAKGTLSSQPVHRADTVVVTARHFHPCQTFLSATVP